MRGRVSKRASIFVALAAVTAMAGGPSAQADHGVEDTSYKTWIQQAGNGAGGSTPVFNNFNMRTVVYDALRFPLPGDKVYTCASATPPCNPNPDYLPRPGATRYYMYGTIPLQGTLQPLLAQVAVSQSDNGLSWSAPEHVTVKDDSTGEDRPLIVSDSDFNMDVAHGVWSNSLGASNEAQFALYWHTTDAADEGAIGGFHRAVSYDGKSFFDDAALTQPATPAQQVVGGAGCAFKCISQGPTDVVYQPGRSTAATCNTDDPDGGGPLAATPWNCRVVMLYHSSDTTAATKLEHVAVAGSPDGRAFTGFATALLSPGAAGAWDDASATFGHVRILPSPSAPLAQRTYTLYYSGAQASPTCAAGAARCSSIGAATSPSQGTSFTKVATPATPRTLLEEFGAAAPHTLQNAAPLDIGKATHQPIYFTRINNSGVKDVYLAFTAPAPTEAPELRFSVPDDFFNSAHVPMTMYLGDTLGTAGNIGVDYPTLTLTLDVNVDADPAPVALDGAVGEKSIVSQYYYSGYKVSVRRDLLGVLPDGVHRVTASITDFDDLTTTKSFEFTVDKGAPVTALSSSPASPKQRTPLGSIGTFRGQTVDGNGTTSGTPLKHLRFAVTNPIGQVKNYDVFYRPDGTGAITATTDRNWDFSWAAPTLDPHFALPGDYTVSALGVDLANNIEDPSAANTVTVMVIP